MEEERKIKCHNPKRVKRLKKMIVSVFISALIIPSLICIIACIRVVQLENEIKELRTKNANTNYYTSDNLAYSNGDLNMQEESEVLVNPAVNTIYDYNIVSDNQVSSNEVSPYEGMKKIYLSFDDGPSSNTDKILDILADYGIKATFFVNGHEGFEAEYIRIVNEGHTIGMHSFSHIYKDIYQDLDSFADDLYKIQTYIYDLTGVTSNVYRFPGGSSNTIGKMSMQDCIEYLNAKNIIYFDWNVSAEDAVTGGASVNTIVNNVIGQINDCTDDTIVVLMHDCQDKKTTVEALPIIIEKLADMDNVVLLPIDAETKPVQHIIY